MRRISLLSAASGQQKEKCMYTIRVLSIFGCYFGLTCGILMQSRRQHHRLGDTLIHTLTYSRSFIIVAFYYYDVIGKENGFVSTLLGAHVVVTSWSRGVPLLWFRAVSSFSCVTSLTLLPACCYRRCRSRRKKWRCSIYVIRMFDVFELPACQEKMATQLSGFPLVMRSSIPVSIWPPLMWYVYECIGRALWDLSFDAPLDDLASRSRS
jgi:hypothetical protein